MKTKPLLVLVALAVVLAAFACCRRDGGWEETHYGNVLPEDFPTERICRVEIKGHGRTVTLEKGADGEWGVRERDGYPANLQQMWELVVTLTQVRMAEPVDLADDAYGLAGEEAVTVALRGGDGAEMAVVRFGRKSELKREELGEEAAGYPAETLPVGRYVQVGEHAALVPYTFALVDDSPEDWLAKEFLQIPNPRRVECIVGGVSEWVVSREDEKSQPVLEGVLPDGVQVDASRLTAIRNASGWIRFSDVEKRDGFVAEREVVVDDFSGLRHRLRIGAASGGRRPLQVSVESLADADDGARQEAGKRNRRFGGWSFLVEERSLAPLLAGRVALLKAQGE